MHTGLCVQEVINYHISVLELSVNAGDNAAIHD